MLANSSLVYNHSFVVSLDVAFTHVLFRSGAGLASQGTQLDIKDAMVILVGRKLQSIHERKHDLVIVPTIDHKPQV